MENIKKKLKTLSIETIVLKLQRGDSLETDKEKAQNVEHRNFQFSVVKDLLELYKEKAQNVEHRNAFVLQLSKSKRLA